jgi:hypothetical protein
MKRFQDAAKLNNDHRIEQAGCLRPCQPIPLAKAHQLCFAVPEVTVRTSSQDVPHALQNHQSSLVRKRMCTMYFQTQSNSKDCMQDNATHIHMQLAMRDPIHKRVRGHIQPRARMLAFMLMHSYEQAVNRTHGCAYGVVGKPARTCV